MTKEKFVEKECQRHGLTTFVLDNSSQHHRCKRCRIDAVNRRRLKLKIQAIEYKGGKCEKCGYDKCLSVLEFHHLDPTKKDFGISAKGHTKSWEKIKNELDKCIMLCSNCHRELHADEFENKRNYLLNTSKPKFKRQPREFKPRISKLKDKFSKEELEKLLWEKPTSQIAKDFGVSDNAIGKIAKKWNLTKPGLGYWAKLYAKNKSA